MATPLMLDDALHAQLTRLASERDQSTDDLVAEAIGWITEAPRAGPGFIAEADASWAKFQRDGLHLTGEEVFAWLDNWDKDRAPPPCHT